MSFMERAAANQELKLNQKYLGFLAQIAPELRTSLGEVVCTENPAWSHQSIDVIGPNGHQLFFHRCRQYWHIGDSPSDGRARQFIKQNPRDPSTQQMFVLQASERLLSEHHFHAYREKLLEFYSELEIPTSLAEKMFDEAKDDLFTAAHEAGGALFSEASGSMWLSGESSGSKPSGDTSKYLTAVRGYLATQGVTDEDLAWFWDLQVIERFILNSEQNVIRTALFVLAMQSKNWNSKEEMDVEAADIVKRIAPAFSSITVEQTKNPQIGDLLPMELYGRVMPWFTSQMKTAGVAGLIELTEEFENMNHWIREHITDISG